MICVSGDAFRTDHRTVTEWKMRFSSGPLLEIVRIRVASRRQAYYVLNEWARPGIAYYFVLKNTPFVIYYENYLGSQIVFKLKLLLMLCKHVCTCNETTIMNHQSYSENSSNSTCADIFAAYLCLCLY